MARGVAARSSRLAVGLQQRSSVGARVRVAPDSNMCPIKRGGGWVGGGGRRSSRLFGALIRSKGRSDSRFVVSSRSAASVGPVHERSGLRVIGAERGRELGVRAIGEFVRSIAVREQRETRA